MRQNLNYYLLVIVVLLVSIILRIPNLDRPISKHHEFNTAFFLIPMEIWEKDGLNVHGFNPPYNYYNKNDKNIDAIVGIKEGVKNGTEYYLSFPSFSYLLPYFYMKLFSLKISVINLQIFNLTIHFILCIFLFGILNIIFDQRSAFIGVSLYIFSPGPLWFHGNGYTHHVLSVFLFVCSLFFLINYLTKEKNKIFYLTFYGASLFLFLYTEWLSVLFLFCLLFYLLFVCEKSRKGRNIIVGSAMVFFLFLATIFYQYDHFFGLNNYYQYLTNRFSHRSTLINHSIQLSDQISGFIKQYVVSYGIWLLLITSFFIIRIFKRKELIFSFNKSNRTLIALIILFPIIIYHIVFMEFTLCHDYSVLIDGIFLACLLGFVSSQIKLSNLKLTITLFIVFIASSLQYYYINPPGKYSFNNDSYDIYKKIGETIKHTSSTNETIFLSGFSSTIDRNNPQIVFYAKRNFLPIDNIDDAYNFLKNNQRKNGKIYILEKEKIKKIIPIQL